LKTLFLTLRVFSATGGIEKVCRIMGKALYESAVENDGILQVASMYDHPGDAVNNPYFPVEIFKGYRVNKIQFIKDMILQGRKSDMVILSHINLLPIAWIIKKISPLTHVLLLAHGIEIWYPLSPRKERMLRHCDGIICVSKYTADTVIGEHRLDVGKCTVLNNCLDPFLPLPSVERKEPGLIRKYGFAPSDKILFTLTRLSSKERYKGYDQVIEAVASLKDKYPGLRYLIAGKYDRAEKKFLDALIEREGVDKQVLLAGFLPDEALEEYFALADIYIMPSRKEGFGIVFIEAMYYGLAVIAGNVDGSVDALAGGQLGLLVDPRETSKLTAAIESVLTRPDDYAPDHQMVMERFSYDTYKQKLARALNLQL
jgi:phosphatidyl-myo-inositol dimannoside synthase